MTKEEAIGLWNKDFLSKQPHITDVINRIYTDFESRICENCKYSEDIEKSYERCEELGINIGRDFGCNLFEPKDK
jgi:hypothetical protein